MKKMFLAVLTSLALCSYGFAQDDEEEYEEDEAPAKVVKKAAVEEEEEEEEAEEEAPAKKKEKKSSRKPGEAILGFGIDMSDAIIGGIDGSVARFSVIYKLNSNMELSAIFGMYHHGETTADVNGTEVGAEDNYTALSIGVGFDYYLGTPILPTSIGGQVIYDSFDEDNSALEFNILFGAHAEVVKNFVVSAQIGLGINYIMGKESDTDTSRLDFGFAPGIKATWYAF
ncbi:MAG: hypothetical protein MJY47_00740 [Fibrobacter sp.]|nr:hypothetical protein [Fibrobacter sp.]